MTITISPTKQVQRINGQLVRVWTGTSANGVPVKVFIAYIGAEEGYDHQEFEAELLNSPEPPFDEEPLTASMLNEIIRNA